MRRFVSLRLFETTTPSIGLALCLFRNSPRASLLFKGYAAAFGFVAEHAHFKGELTLGQVFQKK